MKACRICSLNLEDSLFVKNKAFKTGFDTICRDCSRKKVKEWRKENPEKRKEQVKREGQKDYSHNKHLKHVYGITREEYLKKLEQQHGCCAICKRHQLEFTKRLSVDHCHTTGKIRGLLCWNCNTLLGHAKDKIPTLQEAILYLEGY